MSNKWHFKLPHILVDREEYILKACQGKRVLHLGCVDYPITSEQIKSDRWLHAKLMQVAKEVTGIDNNIAGIEYLKNHGIQNIVHCDAENLEGLSPKIYDVIVAGELLEHLNNPGRFIENIKSVMDVNSLLIISTTNAYCLRRFMRIPSGKESVHPDHIYYFSHSTLTTLLERFNFKIIDAASYRINSRDKLVPYLVETLASLISPNLCEGIIYCVKRD